MRLGRTGRLGVALCAALTLFAGAPAVAQAAPTGTITYVLDGNVWITTPDGAVRRQLTADGAAAPWRHPVMAPDGSVFAVQGNDIVHLAATGAVVSRVRPARLRGLGGVELHEAAPEWVAPSPDGTRLAWGSDWFGCAQADPACTYSSVSAITDVDQATPVAKYGQAPTFKSAAWITDTRLIGTESATGFWADLWDVGAAPTRWFESYDQLGLVWDLWEPDVAPNRRLIAMVALRPNMRGLIVISRSAADLASGVPAIPTPLCEITETLRIDASPSWSPDGQELAYADPKGIQVNTWPREIQGPGDCLTPEPRTIAPAGAREPDWGPASVLVTPTPTPSPGGGPPPGGPPANPGGPLPTPGPPTGTPGPGSPPTGCVIPKVKPGSRLAPLQSKLTGCRVKLTRVRSAKVRKGRVIRVSREAGGRWPAGAKVTVYVSSGRAARRSG